MSLAERLCEWLLTSYPEIEPEELERSEDLIEDGILDSLRLVEMIARIEALRGHEIPRDLLVKESFRSLATIERLFFTH